MKDGRYALIEIKLDSFEIEEGAEHLLKLRDLIRANTRKGKQCLLREPDLLMVITGGKTGYTRSDGGHVVTAETGAPVISGIQGRYFLPCLPLLGMGLTSSIPLRKYREVTERLTVALLLALYGIVLLKLATCNWPPVH